MQFSDIRNKAIGLIVWSQLTSKVKRFIAIKFGLLSAKNRPSLYAVFGRGITVRILLLIFLYGISSQDSKKVWHCFLAQMVQKLLTF